MLHGRLKDKAIVITGATRGIGRGIALAAAVEGANVIVSGRNEIEGKELVDEIKNSYKRDALYVRCDVSIVENCREFIESAVSCFGKIDGIVNNAGIFPYKPFLEVEEEDFDHVFDVNVKGAFFCTKYAVKEMLKKNGGSIINIGSTHAYGGNSELSVYSCSKGALHTLTKNMALNYAKNGIRSNWITVGWVLTPGEISGAQSRGIKIDNLKEKAFKLMPESKFQTVADIANGVVFLLSDDAAQVTGTDLHITGGFNLPY